MVLLRSSDRLKAKDLPPEGDESPDAPQGVRVGTDRASGGEASGASTIRAGGAGRPRESGSDFLGELPDGRLSLIDVEREIIARALAKHGGNQSKTAEYLGIPRHVLLYRLEKFGIK